MEAVLGGAGVLVGLVVASACTWAIVRGERPVRQPDDPRYDTRRPRP